LRPEMYVAIIALVVAIWQGIVNRRHNRLSIKPSLRIDRCIFATKSTFIELCNTGAGPAIIKSIRVFVDAEPLPGDTRNPQLEALSKLGLSDLQWQTYDINPGESFGAGERHEMILLVSPIKDSKTLERVKNGLLKISYEIKYASVYGEESTLPHQW